MNVPKGDKWGRVIEQSVKEFAAYLDAKHEDWTAAAQGRALAHGTSRSGNQDEGETKNAKYRAHYTNHGADICVSTRWYTTIEAAQDALMKHREVGFFHHLGEVCGDASETGHPCLYAPRNGGAVDIDVQSDS